MATSKTTTKTASVVSFNVTVVPHDGETFDVATNSYDLFRAERELGSLKLLEGKLSWAEMAAVTWSAARRQDRAGDDFEAWLQEVDLSFDADEDPKDA